MAASPIPPSGITLQCPPNDLDSVPAVLLKLSENVVRDIARASREKNGVQFVTGSTPKFRLGTRTIDLAISPSRLHTEIYSSQDSAHPELLFSACISHRAEIKTQPKNEYDTSGADAALQSKMASYEQEKQANETTIDQSIRATPKNRFEAAKGASKQKIRRKVVIPEWFKNPPTPDMGKPPTSVPTEIDQEAAMKRAFKVTLIHNLALGLMTLENLRRQSCVPLEEIKALLPKIAKEQDGKLALVDRAYKELDIYETGFYNKEQTKTVVDNAIRVYDRLRIGKDEKLWQLLLPPQDRNKGIVLSKLNFGAAPVRGLTPNHASNSTPLPDAAEDQLPNSSANTPRFGASPRPSTSKGGDVMKRLLSKDPKKARAAEDAKEKKRKEREAARDAAASDRENPRPAKRQTTKTSNPKVKSAEFVHSSDDSEMSDPKAPVKRADSKVEAKRPKPSSRDSANEITVQRKTIRPAAPPPATQRPRSGTAGSVGKATPRGSAIGTAPNSRDKGLGEPKKPSRPVNPSPLGAGRPRASSNISVKAPASSQRVTAPAGSPRGLGITHGVVRKPAVNGIKRKAEDGIARDTAVKHRKTGSGSSQSLSSAVQSTANTSPSMAADSGSSSSPANPLEDINFGQGMTMAEKFRRRYYPAYMNLYDEIEAKKKRGEEVMPSEADKLWTMHRRLEQMKREIGTASRRGR